MLYFKAAASFLAQSALSTPLQQPTLALPPSNLKDPSQLAPGSKLKLIALGLGHQNYTCRRNPSGALTADPIGATATLFDVTAALAANPSLVSTITGAVLENCTACPRCPPLFPHVLSAHLPRQSELTGPAPNPPRQKQPSGPRDLALPAPTVPAGVAYKPAGALRSALPPAFDLTPAGLPPVSVAPAGG